MNVSNRLKNKVAIVTAAAQGIGRAVAERLASEGAIVHASDLNGSGLEGLKVASTQQLDATDQDAVSAYAAKFDKIDILVHAVGYVHHGSIEECSLEDWRRTMSISLDSAFIVVGAFIPKMKAGGGSVINIASVASSTKGFAKRVAYGAAKGGVIGLTKAVAADYIAENIRCNAVCPGTVASPSLQGRIEELATKMGSYEAAEQYFLDRQPAGRFGTTEEIAAMCAFLGSEDGRFVNGQTINVDGGITI
ncbi:MAG: SDR family oxidoreductase [Rhizobiales bacterium]|nr:SDR family oxidoreductase [Hyphomicrobiales bacterium]